MSYKEYVIALIEDNGYECTIDRYEEPDDNFYGVLEIVIYKENFSAFCSIDFEDKEDIKQAIIKFFIKEF